MTERGEKGELGFEVIGYFSEKLFHGEGIIFLGKGLFLGSFVKGKRFSKSLKKGKRRVEEKVGTEVWRWFGEN